MCHEADGYAPPDGLTIDPEQLKAVLSGLTHGEIQDRLERLVSAQVQRFFGSLEPTPPASRRRPRRQDVITYRVRVDLQRSKPPLWRRLELASDLYLDQVHQVIQVAFGWADSHLHQFGSGPGHYDPRTEHYLCPFEVEEGAPGIPEDEVRLDEVLVEVGDKLFYDYDFGDDWQHVIKLEAVLGRTGNAPRAVCTAGRRDGPPEDCGGVYAYELICAAVDPANADHPDAAAEFTRVYGYRADGAHTRTTPFDIEEINRALAAHPELGEADQARAGHERN